MTMATVVVVGPTHPFKGGIARHTTELALAFESQGLDVRIESWKAQYPARLYPGEQQLSVSPEGPVVRRTRRGMNWFDPSSWLRAGRRSADADLVVIALSTPIQIPAYLALLMAARPHRLVVVCHNVLPHEPNFFDRPLVSRMLSRADRVITHTDAEATLAAELGAEDVRVAPLAPHFPTEETARQEGLPIRNRVLFFGLVRPYKGLDILLQALVKAEDVSLTIAGEVWGSVDELQDRIDTLGIGDRVDLIPSYLPADEISTVFGQHDALVLPYLDGTASQNVLLAHQLGLPVVASRVGSFPAQIRHGVDGLLTGPGDVADLAQALNSLYEDDTIARLRSGVPESSDRSTSWNSYLSTIQAS